MKIGLIDIDSHHFPNLCQMKLSAYHRARGDRVEWWNGFEHYDLVYKSRIFTDEYSRDTDPAINADQIICGGTGFDLQNRLPDVVEHQRPDYTLYPQFPDTAYGFLTRGCPKACGFCIVSAKEGRRSAQAADLSEFWDGQRTIKLLDANLLASAEHEQLLEQLAVSGAWVDFTQGLDIRLINSDNIRLLNNIKTEMLHFAWDDPKDDLTDFFKRFAELSKVQSPRRRGVYVLCNYGSTHEEDLYRVYTLRGLGFDPYVMIYNKYSAPRQTRLLQRWVNNKRIFGIVSCFKDYNTKFG